MAPPSDIDEYDLTVVSSQTGIAFQCKLPSGEIWEAKSCFFDEPEPDNGLTIKENCEIGAKKVLRYVCRHSDLKLTRAQRRLFIDEFASWAAHIIED